MTMAKILGKIFGTSILEKRHEGMKMELIKKLLNKITVENVNIQIANGWESSHTIAKYIVGMDIWEALPTWDQQMLASRVHKVVKENSLLPAP